MQCFCQSSLVCECLHCQVTGIHILHAHDVERNDKCDSASSLRGASCGCEACDHLIPTQLCNHLHERAHHTDAVTRNYLNNNSYETVFVILKVLQKLWKAVDGTCIRNSGCTDSAAVLRSLAIHTRARTARALPP